MNITPPPFIIDTNVLVAAMGNFYGSNKPMTSNARWAIAGIQREVHFFYFPALLNEYFKVLRDKPIKGMPQILGKLRPPPWFENFLENGTFIGADPVINKIVGYLWAADDVDQRILQCASLTNSVVVTNDVDDFREDSRAGVHVLKPDEAIKQFAPHLYAINQWPK